MKLLFVAALLLASAPRAWAHEVVVGEDGVTPRVLTVKTGERVDFRNPTGRYVHIEFAGDPRQHEVVQVPVTGPVWAVFHRPGTHPYVVHVATGRDRRDRRTLAGVVDVIEDETHRWDSKTCGVVVMGECIEP